MRRIRKWKMSVRRPLAFLLIVALVSMLFSMPGGIPNVTASTIMDPPFSITSLPSYAEHVAATGHTHIKSVTIAEYAQKYGTAEQYSADYRLRIDSAAHLYQFSSLCNHPELSAHYLGLNYLLGNNIDYAGFFEDHRQAFIPVGTANEAGDVPFTGTFDGQGFEIRNLIFDADISTVNTNRYYALFGATSGTLRNFGLVNPVINIIAVQGNMHAAGIAGKNLPGGVIEFVYVDDTRVYSDNNPPEANPGYRGASAYFAGLVVANYAGATLSNAYYSGNVAQPGSFSAPEHIHPVALTNDGAIDEVYYNTSRYPAADIAVGNATATTNRSNVIVTADDAARFEVGDVVSIGSVPYDCDIAAERVITGITGTGANRTINFEGDAFTTPIGSYISSTKGLNPAPSGSGSGTVRGVGAKSLETRKGCLTHAKWRTHAYEAVSTAHAASLRSNPRLYGFSGYASEKWGSDFPFLISTPADLIYFSYFFSQAIGGLTNDKKYRISACIDMSAVAPDAYCYTSLPNTTSAFSFSGEVGSQDSCGVTHYETKGSADRNHAILNLTMTKSIAVPNLVYSTKLFPSAEAIGFIPAVGTSNSSAMIRNLNFIGGLCRPPLNPAASAIFAGAVAGLSYSSMSNVHSSMDVIIPDGETGPLYAGGLVGYSSALATDHVSFSGKVSGGIHPYPGDSRAPNIEPTNSYTVGGIIGSLSASGAKVVVFTNLLSDGVVEAPGFYDVALVDGKYIASNTVMGAYTAPLGVLAGGVFGGVFPITTGGGTADSDSVDRLLLLNQSALYSVPMADEGVPRTAPGGKTVYSLSPAIGGIQPIGHGLQHKTGSYLINRGNIYCYNMIGTAAIAGLLAANARNSHGTMTNNSINFGDITVRNSSGNLHVAGVQSKVYWNGGTGFISTYNYGDISVDSSNQFDLLAVGGISALGHVSGNTMSFYASEQVYNYGDISVDSTCAAIDLYVAGLYAASVSVGVPTTTYALNDGAIRVNTAQTSGALTVNGMGHTSFLNAANRGAISLNATGRMSADIHVAGLSAVSRALLFTNSVNAGKIEVTADTSGTVFTGGLFSDSSANTVVESCLNSGSIQVTNSGGAVVGGIAGRLLSSTNRRIIDSINSGAIRVTSSGTAAVETGGIVGSLGNKFWLHNCINYGAISTTMTNSASAIQSTGGIVGSMNQAITAAEYTTGLGMNGAINFGDVRAVTNASSTANLSTGGIVGSYKSGTVFRFSNLINYADVAQTDGAGTQLAGSIGSIAGKVDFGGAKVVSDVSFSNHLNTKETLNLYGTYTAMSASASLSFVDRTGLVTVNAGDRYLGGTPTTAHPLTGQAVTAANGPDGIYDPESDIAATLTRDCFVFAEKSVLAAARQPAFDHGMYALTIFSQDAVFLPEGLILSLIDPPSVYRGDNEDGVTDPSWRTAPCKDVDGAPIPGSAVDDHYAFILQVDVNPVILSMSLETTTYYSLCSYCANRPRADHLLHSHGVDTADMSVAEMTAEISRLSILCPNCGRANLGAVYSEYTIDDIQVRDNATNTLYFYAAENHIGSSLRIRSWDTNIGTVVADPDTEGSVGLLRFDLPATYDGTVPPEELTQSHKVYLMPPGGLEPIEYTVVLGFIPNPKISLYSVTSSRQDTVPSTDSKIMHHPSKLAATLPIADDGAYIIEPPIYYSATNSSPLMSFQITTENIAPGYMPRYNTTVTHDETGVDYTYTMNVVNPQPGETVPDKFLVSLTTQRHSSVFSMKDGTPTYSGTTITSGGNTLFTERLNATFPEGWYTLRMHVNNKVLLAIRFYRARNNVGFPVPSVHYAVDMESRTATRTNTVYGLASRPTLFYPFGANNRGSDHLLYPASASEQSGAICVEGERLLVDVVTNPDGTHTYTNRVSYIPETGEADKTWWTVKTFEGLTATLALEGLVLNEALYDSETGFDVETPSATTTNTIKFTGRYTENDHSNKVASSAAADMFIKFYVNYNDGNSDYLLEQVPGSNDYSPRFSLDGKSLLSIEQTKIKSENNPAVARLGEYTYLVTLDKDAPQGEYEVYFVYEVERQIPLHLFDEDNLTPIYETGPDGKPRVATYTTTLNWHYEFPTPLTIKKPFSSDSYLRSINFPGTLLEEITCTTPGHSHVQVATVSGGVINYATSKLTGDDRDTHFNLDLYFPVGYSTANKLLTLQTAGGATISRKVGGVWEEVAAQHMVDFVRGTSYEYRIESQMKGDFTYYTIKIHELPRNKTLNIEAVAGAGITNLQAAYEELGEDLLISVKQLVTDETGTSQVHEMYNATFIPNNGMHLPYRFPNVSAGTYVLDVHVPPGYAFEVIVGSARQTLTDNTVSGIKFTLGELQLTQLINITVRVSKIAQYTRPDGLYVDWHSHRAIPQPVFGDTEFDVVFQRTGRLFVDISPAEHPNVILSPRQIYGSQAPGTCFAKGSVTIPEGVTITGDIFAKGDVIVNGTVNGNIRSERTVEINGTLNGFAEASGSVIQSSSGQINGGS